LQSDEVGQCTVHDPPRPIAGVRHSEPGEKSNTGESGNDDCSLDSTNQLPESASTWLFWKVQLATR
jgi:hypothetical protein